MHKIKKKIRNFIKHFLLIRGFRLQHVNYIDFLNMLLYKIIQKQGHVKYIQIGANDGIRFDPVFEFLRYNASKTNGLVVEPVEDYYNALVRNYSRFKKIITVHKAIHNTEKQLNIYRVSKKHETLVPEFALGIASFNPQHHKKTGIPEAYISSEKVNCISFQELLNTYEFWDANVLIIDTEGYDYEILKEIDFKHFKPFVIHFEHGLKTHTMSVEQFNEITRLLSANNYQLFIDESDVTAYRTDLIFDYKGYV